MEGLRCSLRIFRTTGTFSVLLLLCYFCASPVLSSDIVNNIQVSEGTHPSTVLWTLPAKRGFRYLLRDSSSNGASLFHVSPEGVLTTTSTLDHEDKRGFTFDLIVVCREINRTEGGSATNVRVTVLDENDNTPKFPKDLYTASVSENSPAGSYVYGLEGVFAEDLDFGKNAVHSYSIAAAGNEAGLFVVEMNELTGVKFVRVKTTAPIDREKTDFFVLTLQVKDNGNKPLSSSTQVRINILDENDCYPLFDPPIYSLSVNENTAVGTSVLQVKATDADAGRNSDIYYYFTKDHDFFAINAHTGIVTVASQLSFEQGSYIELTVVAADRGGITQHNSSTLVKIDLKNVFGYPPLETKQPAKSPVFEPRVNYVKVREDLPVKAVTAHIRTVAVVEYRRPHLQYELFPSYLRGTFYINSKSGIITLLRSLDYETKRSYTLKIRAKDLYNQKFVAETEVIIEIADVDENLYPPVFKSASTVVTTMAPNAGKNTIIARISAADRDKGQNGQLRYSVVGGNGAGRFSLDENTGVLRTFGGSHNMVEGSRRDLHIEARDGAKFPRSARLYLLILSGTKNRKRPYFPSPSQVAMIQENSAVGTFVHVVRAELRGERSRETKILQYNITGGNEERSFNIGKETGVIYTTTKLDREHRSRYALDIRASIKGEPDSMNTPAQLVVMVTDVNDNDPKFLKENFKVKIKENQGLISNLVCLIATDADTGSNANLSYSIVDGNAKGLFSVHPSLGTLSVRDSLDYERKRKHLLTVQVNDGGTPSRSSTAGVTVLVEDANDPPVFLQKTYKVVVSDSTNIGTIIAVLDITDEDFEHTYGGKTVSAEEDAQPASTLTVINVTDEDSGQQGDFECTIDDVDADEMDTFNFRTVSQGCALTLSSFLKYSQRSLYSFKVRATDKANPANRHTTSANVIVRVQDGNNNSPTFSQSTYWVSLSDDTVIGTEVLTITTTDLDTGSNADTAYLSSMDKFFSIHPKDGTIKLQQRAEVNRKYTFAVTASDQGKPSKSSVVEVSVSVHGVADSPPTFSSAKYKKEIPEDLSPNTEVIKIEARNGAGSDMKLSYYIVGGDPKMQFRIDSDTGWLSLKQSLDYEKRKEYRLVVRAVQQGWSANMPDLPAETAVLIKVKDVNDNAPRFAIPQDPLVTSVDQFLPVGSVVTKLTAYDRDSNTHGTITYGIKNSRDLPFTIDSKTGTVTTTKVLQYADAATYSFVATATDSTPPYNTGRANLKVDVSEVSPPVEFHKQNYDIRIPEDSQVGRFLLKLQPIFNGHSSLKYSITHGNHRNAFCIDSTGNVMVRKQLDRESVDNYTLKIKVQKNKDISTGPTLKVQLTDVNDNAPKFLRPVYKIFVKENLKGGHVVATLSARDADIRENSRLVYSIVNFENTRSDHRFNIDLNTGVLRSTRTLDRESLDQHVLTVRARDAGIPRLSGLVHVVVIVQDVNDHAPTFSSTSYSVSIPMTTRVLAPVFQALAHDFDRDANGAVRYGITSGNTGRAFRIDPYESILYLRKPLTGLDEFHMKIEAHDSGRPMRTSSAAINVTVYPLPGPPRFLSPSFSGNVIENTPAGRFVLQIKAASLDPVMYSIVSGNEAKKFQLHPGSGWLTTLTSLDYEEQPQYNLTVMATDLTNRMSRIKVMVNITNLNDNKPKFLNAEESVIEGTVLADVSIGSPVMSVRASDADKNDALWYSIDDEKAATYFKVSSSGMVKSKRVLRDLKNPFIFSLGVRDSGTKPHKGFAVARLVLLRYQLQQGEHRANVLEDAVVGSQVTTLRPANPVKNARFSIVSPRKTSFQINRYSGVVTIKTQLDYEAIKSHRFIVQVQNSLNEKDYTNIDVVIYVLDSNDNKPMFTMKKKKKLYLAYVNLNPEPGTSVYRLNATDRDMGPNGHVRYRIVRDRDGFFHVGSRDGVMTTRGRNLLMLPWYNLTVAAFDLGQPSLSNEVLVNVKTGVFPPKFEKKEYVFHVDENTHRGVTVGAVKAKSFSGVLLWYSIVQGNDNGQFVLDSNTGRLTLPNPLNYERDSNIYHLKVRAEETAISPRLHNDVSVKILLRDVNDNPPEFVQQRYVDSLPESAPVGTTVLAVTALDRDSGINGQFRYFVQSRFFSVDRYTGWITTKKKLDYEAIPRHAFLVVAQDAGIPARNGTARVIVELTNVNDNKPVFSQNLYNVFIAENAGSGQVVGTVQATDKDLDEVKYSIASGDNTTNFVIDSKTGVIRLIQTRKPELKGPYYTMNISATDGYHVSQAMVVVVIEDVNNHKPVFTECDSYKPTVPEHSPRNSFVLKVVAEDKDTGVNGEIEYSIERSRDSPWYFEINSKTGEVTTLQEFDREEKSQYQLHIIGRDGGRNRQDAERLMGFCQVNVEILDKNDHPPVFQNKHYEASIGEDFDIGRSVLHVSANDKDAGPNALITYFFEAPNEFFAIDNATGTITTKAKLTGETRKFFLQVVAQDNGKPQLNSQVEVTVTVFGDGNAPPKFKKALYEAKVLENVATSHSVITVTASANNNQNIYYSIVPGNLPSTNNPKRFQIGTITGEIQTSQRLDFETTPNFTLTIRAETSSNPPGINFATLKIYLEDVNDSPPEFRMPRYQGHVSENSPIETSVIKVGATDLDEGENGRITYRFAQHDSLKYFSLDESLGLIKTKQVFDREKCGRYTLVVNARDHGKPSKTSNTIVEVIVKDDNDNPPIFEQLMYNISLFEDVSIGSDVLKVSATDKDLGINARVSYQITEGNTGAVFGINRDFGTINVASSLDREKKEFYKLEITARDGKNSGRAFVNVIVKDINDNNPTFEELSYQVHVKEREPVGTPVLKLTATDPDQGPGGTFRFSISGQGLSAFQVDPYTGVITTREVLDRELKSRYDFLAFAVDAPGFASRRTGSTDVTVIVRDVNDNKPHFPNFPYVGRVQENLKAGASVMVMSAVDDDDPNEGGNAKMTYELIYDARGVFSIDRDSGLIRTTRQLDRETQDRYVVKVGATDKGETPQEGDVNVTIIVEDANDQRPQFIKPIFKASVSESADLGSTIITLRATDNDIGINSKLRYSIDKGNDDRQFRIEEDTGKLLVAKSLDFEIIRDYDLEIKVSDLGVPSYSDTAEVYVTVLDDNDNPPVFKPVAYSASFEEDIDIGTKLVQVTASDLDTGENKKFRYSIAEGDPRGIFRIDSETGELYNQKPLDREANANHILSVRATNIGTSKVMYGQASVIIDVVDVNDNGPHFNPYVTNPFMPENEPPPYDIVTLTAFDPDSNPANGGPFTYGIVEGYNTEGLFELTTDGKLTSRVQFDREAQDVYHLKVWGEDSGKPHPVRNTTWIHIHIKDRNDHQHEKAHLDLTLNSYEGHFPGGHVGHVYVKDKDTDDERFYELLATDSDIFRIDRMSGSIVSKPNPPEGAFSMTVKVSDRDSEFKPVECTVKIHVIKISDEAIQKSVAIRLRGMDRRTFVKDFLDFYKEFIAESLETDIKNVDLFSIQNVSNNEKPTTVDVRFAAHGSPYYSPEKMVAIIKSKRMSLRRFNVSVGVDPCLHEPCKYGSCRSELRVPGGVQVISVGRQSFTSIIVNQVGVCEACSAGKKLTSTCKDDPCLNGGSCRDTPVGHLCACPLGLHGKHCELTTRGFEAGEWVWLPPLRQCRASTLSLEFATKESTGLLLYAGPTSPVEADQDDVYDFLSVELHRGKIYVSVCLGDRNDILKIGVGNGDTLNDGKWHHVEIYRNETFVRLIVDHCKHSIIDESDSSPKPTENRSMCEVKGRLKKKKKKFLNLKEPLQLGGISTRDMMYPDLLHKDFNGCIRNVKNQGVLIDLKNPSNRKGSREGCPVMDKHCYSAPCHSKAACVGSWAGYTCKCPAGQRGDTCWEVTEPVSFHNQSITQYLLLAENFLYNTRETKIELQIRTRDEDGGIILHSVGTDRDKYSSLAVVRDEKSSSKNRSRLVVAYSFDLGDGGATVTADDVDVGDGKWCTIRVNRYRNRATLTVVKDGVKYETTGTTRGKRKLLVLDPIQTYIGGIPRISRFPTTVRQRRRRRSQDIQRDFTGCVNDVRFHGYPLHFNGTKDFGTALSTGVSKGCESAACTGNPCVATQWCYDAWRKHFCYPRLCASVVCHNGGTCYEGVDKSGGNKFFCKCTPEFQGTLCNVGRAVVSLRPDIGFENGLIIGLSLLLVTLVISACVVIMYIKRSRRYSYNVTVEEVFKRDNVADYHIDGGVEEDVDERFRDYIETFDDERDDCVTLPSMRRKVVDSMDSNRSDRGYGGSSDASPTFILLRPVRNAREVRQSPSPSGKSSEDESHSYDYHYGRAVAVDLSTKGPHAKRRSDPVDFKKKNPEQRKSAPSKLNIILNPLRKGAKPEKGQECRERTPKKKSSVEEKIDEGVESVLSSSDEGFASPESNGLVEVEIPVKRQSKAPKATSKPKEPRYVPVKASVRYSGVEIDDVPFSSSKNADAGSDPDEVSSPPDKVPGPEHTSEEKEPRRNCPSPSVRLHEANDRIPQSSSSDRNTPKHIRPTNGNPAPQRNGIQYWDDGVPTAPEDFPPPYDLDPDEPGTPDSDFPPPPKEALNFTADPEYDPLKRVRPPPQLPHPAKFLPADVVESFNYEGVGSPSGSLSSLGSDAGDEVTWEDVNEFGDRFRKLAGIYGKPPTVTFNPNDEIIK